MTETRNHKILENAKDDTVPFPIQDPFLGKTSGSIDWLIDQRVGRGTPETHRIDAAAALIMPPITQKDFDVVCKMAAIERLQREVRAIGETASQ